MAEIVSLPAYESQVSGLMDEEERAAREFFIACAPEVHPVIARSGGFCKARRARQEWWFSGQLFHDRTGANLHGIYLGHVTKANTLGCRSE